MSNSDTNERRTDGGTVEQEIFGTSGDGDGGRRKTSPQERFRRLIDTYFATPFRIAWNDWRARIGGLGVLLYILMGVVGPRLVDQPTLNWRVAYTGAFIYPDYPLGTDYAGRDMMTSIIHATPAMLKMALAGVLFSIGVAVIFGFVSGYKGGMIDTVMMTLTDVMITLPGLPLIILIAAVYPPQDPFIVGAILAIDNWPGLARNLRSQVLTLREESYVEASRTMGLSTTEIIGKDLIPQLAPFVLISSAGAATGVISESVALYYLGILPSSSPIDNWGVMLHYSISQADAVNNWAQAGHMMLFPLLALSGMTFFLILLGQGLDQLFNPRLRARHSSTTSDEGDERP